MLNNGTSTWVSVHCNTKTRTLAQAHTQHVRRQLGREGLRLRTPSPLLSTLLHPHRSLSHEHQYTHKRRGVHFDAQRLRLVELDGILLDLLPLHLE
jgi:hypothetical protein